MKQVVRVLSISALAATAALSFAGARMKTPLLSELNTILSVAHQNILKGDYHGANALANLVLFKRVVRIQVSTDAATLPRRAECVKALRDGVASWEKALGGEVRFAFISDAKRAEIKVRFAEDLGGIGRHVAGHADYLREIVGNEARTTAKLHILAAMPDGRPMEHDHMRHTVMHEFGHVLGLEDSDEVGAVMGPLDFESPATEITPVEIEDLLWARTEASNLSQRLSTRIYAMRR